jgi:hypothetical protein
MKRFRQDSEGACKRRAGAVSHANTAGHLDESQANRLTTSAVRGTQRVHHCLKGRAVCKIRYGSFSRHHGLRKRLLANDPSLQCHGVPLMAMSSSIKE